MSRNSTNRRLPEASYIALAKEFVKARSLRMKANDEEKAAKRLCAVAMHSVGKTGFAFDVEGVPHKAKLARKTEQSVCIQKLYTAVRSGEVSLDEFLTCVEVNDERVLSLYGQDFFDRVSTFVRGPLNLFIGKVKK